jgi:sulfate adenylyltransferase
VLIHSLIGNLKPGDIPAKVRIKAIDALIENYFVKDNAYSAGYPLDMRYAGPREGLLHATFRQNYGVNNMLIGPRSCRGRRLLYPVRGPGDFRPHPGNR